MKRIALVGFLLTSTLFLAQTTVDKNPVVSAARVVLERQSRNLTQAAETMPADKFNFQPTPQQMTFAKLVAHVATANQVLCAKLAGSTPPQSETKDSSSKDALVSALKASFDSCTTSLGKLEDAALGQPVTLFGGRQSTKAGALLALTNDWADHYAAAAIYLRLNGLLPPTAKPQK
jgi:uncharacterized damage-inducible protein DinB